VLTLRRARLHPVVPVKAAIPTGTALWGMSSRGWMCCTGVPPPILLATQEEDEDEVSAGIDSELEAALRALPFSELRTRAEGSPHVRAADLEQAADEVDPHSAIIELILRAKTAEADLRAQLSSKKLSELRIHARALGADAAMLSRAEDSCELPRDGVLQLVIDLEAGETAVAAAPEMPTLKPHQGQTSSVVAKHVPPDDKHAMVSYSWSERLSSVHCVSQPPTNLSLRSPSVMADYQPIAVRARETLQQNGIHTWMDIDGGMMGDIYDCMASAVDNASVVVGENPHHCLLPLSLPRWWMLIGRLIQRAYCE